LGRPPAFQTKASAASGAFEKAECADGRLRKVDSLPDGEASRDIPTFVRAPHLGSVGGVAVSAKGIRHIDL